MFEYLRTAPLFENLSDEDLEKLCRGAEQLQLAAGEQLFAEGSQGKFAYVIQEGELEISKVAHGQEILLAVRGPGELIGEMALLQKSTRTATVRAKSPCRLLSIGYAQLDELLNTHPAAARTMLQTITTRWRSTQALLRESEKMAQLGSLAAGMAHELNNPSTAALRGSQQLRDWLGKFQRSSYFILNDGLDETAHTALFKLLDDVLSSPPEGREIDALERSDLESELEDWLENHGIPDAWEYAPVLVEMSLVSETMETFLGQFPRNRFAEIVAWICSAFTIRNLIQEIGEGARRISELVNALKSYSFLDQAPTQTIDVHEGLNDTLILLRNKLKKGVTVIKDYDESLPLIQAHGSELNQVWTNIIDNAIHAMQGKGQLTIRTRKEDKYLVVDIQDNGPGIPPEIRDRIFEPYFTSKPPGEGTGLGLDISKKVIQEKHNGVIKVASNPGSTTFSVYLPIHAAGEER